MQPWMPQLYQGSACTAHACTVGSGSPTGAPSTAKSLPMRNQPPHTPPPKDQSPAAALQVAGEGDRALAQLAGLVRLVAGASLQGPAAVVALKAARTVVADRPSLVGRLAPALLAVASRLAPGAAAGLTGGLGWLPCWLCGRTCVCC